MHQVHGGRESPESHHLVKDKYDSVEKQRWRVEREELRGRRRGSEEDEEKVQSMKASLASPGRISCPTRANHVGRM